MCCARIIPDVGNPVRRGGLGALGCRIPGIRPHRRRVAHCGNRWQVSGIMQQNIGFISTRFAGTDGVSLESAKWAEVLWEDKHISFWYAGWLDRAASISMCIPEAHFQHPDNRWINEQLWGRKRRSPEVGRRVRDLSEYLKLTLYEYVDRFDLTLLVIQNALTIPMHVPLGIAITEFLQETEIPAIAHHHDFYWERGRFQNSAAADYLDMAFPPRARRLQHVVINQAARDALAWRKGLPSILIPNVLDFHNPPPPIDDYAADVRSQIGLGPEDRLILQPTRIVPRKGIENSITLVRRMKDPRCRLVISHAAGDEGEEYPEQIVELADDEGVDLILFGERVADVRQTNSQGKKVYVLRDLYPHANLVTFPSTYEGFGNAFLEAIYFRVPILVNRYDVFVRDIEPKGFRVPMISSFVDRNAVREARRLIDDQDYRAQITNHNYGVAKHYYSYRVLRNSLRALIRNVLHRTD
jgi:glycosyltransferase involved in cell wall biosynthesis